MGEPGGHTIHDDARHDPSQDGDRGNDCLPRSCVPHGRVEGKGKRSTRSAGERGIVPSLLEKEVGCMSMLLRAKTGTKAGLV